MKLLKGWSKTVPPPNLSPRPKQEIRICEAFEASSQTETDRRKPNASQPNTGRPEGYLTRKREPFKTISHCHHVSHFCFFMCTRSGTADPGLWESFTAVTAHTRRLSHHHADAGHEFMMTRLAKPSSTRNEWVLLAAMADWEKKPSALEKIFKHFEIRW